MCGLMVLCLSALPVNFTWGPGGERNYLTPAPNQNNPLRCESGWAWAVINSLNARANIRIARSGLKLPLVSLATQVLLECDQRDSGCLGVFFCRFRENPHRRLLGSAGTVSLTPPAIPTRREDIPMARDAAAAVNARCALPKIFARDRATPRYTRCKVYLQSVEKTRSWRRSLPMGQSHAALPRLMNSRITRQVSSWIRLECMASTIMCLFTGGERPATGRSTGTFRILTVRAGENRAVSGC